MAIEYVTLPGTGEKVAVDTVDTSQVQVVKIMHGLDGVNDGLVDSTTPLPVGGTEANSGSIKTATEAVNTALQTAGITQVQLAAIKTAVEVIDNFISGSKGLVTEDSAVAIKTAVEAINTALQTSGITQVQFAAMVTALQLIDNAVNGNFFDINNHIEGAAIIPIVAALDSTGGGIATAGMVAQFDDASTAAVTENQFAPVRMSTRRALLVEGVASGTAQGVSIASGGIAAGAIAAGGVVGGALLSGAFASGSIASGAIASGAVASGAIAAGAVVAGATSFVKLEDVASADADAGVAVLAIRDDTCDIRSGTEGDYEPFHTDAVGRLWVDPQGNVAHDAGDSGNPVKVGYKVESTPSAQVCADADRTDGIADMDGAHFVRSGCLLGDCLTESVSNTNGTATACAVFTTGAGIRNIITDIVAYNSSATAGFVIITDGSGGTTLMAVPLPAGGGAVINLMTPIKSTAATAIYFDVSGALTTVYLTFTGYRTKVT